MSFSKLYTRHAPLIRVIVKIYTAVARFDKDIAHKYYDQLIVTRISYRLKNLCDVIYVSLFDDTFLRRWQS